MDGRHNQLVAAQDAQVFSKQNSKCLHCSNTYATKGDISVEIFVLFNLGSWTNPNYFFINSWGNPVRNLDQSKQEFSSVV